MSDSLLNKLHSLDASLQTVLAHYETALDELNRLKQQPHVEMTKYTNLEHQLTEATHLQTQTINERDSLKEQLTKLEADYEKLAENHHGLTHTHNALIEQCDQLKEANRVLQEKNQTASEHARVILERLTRIDQASH